MSKLRSYSAHARLMDAFYRCHTSTLLDQALIGQTIRQAVQNVRAVPGKQPHALVVGSYGFAVIPHLHDALSVTVTDLSSDMLALRPAGQGVQSDARALPFTEAFDLAAMVGCLTAHMLTPADLAACASSLWQALRRQGRLLVDAYDSDTIAHAAYFNTAVRFELEGKPWVRHAAARIVSTCPFLFETTIRFAADDAQAVDTGNEVILQRGFSPDELRDAFTCAGFSVLAQHWDKAQSRLYLVLEKP